ncbi:undecaprenyl/decaprenyl-phosphate alpha-N-acetylglucosaminyl 1-phosphate transferase [Sandaracinomonas limnophila]|uniref:Undecaprenyl/decaprenyl-phosphate alpha-N-acetylglucosaminyl 1-phosphate transferase n=1 Tax=Sandaracinomonas limnophila TaxID=1862386 RepID=A0A437PWR4_9BACT|nr:MraY family glycosyltransferase [Sandaracinomonas limnophila]RVU26707.1 undecaprenyl/decaprenyl-phosphate alpha-N-acetylglucosaminyl 1-phosphate transferase [Sandaracinomonas limnophila]
MYFNELLQVKEIQIFLSFIISLIISITTIPVIINISKLKDLMAEVQLRSSHDEVTPTLGGVAIFASTLISYFIWDNPSEGHDTHLTIAAIIILFFLGIKDDILILSPKKKLIIQIAASLMLITLGNIRISNLYGLFGIYQIPYIFSILFTVFIFISIINSLNLLDGIDGLAGTVGVWTSVVFSYLFYNLGYFAHATLSLALAGSLVGFLRYNWSKKNKIFMGDTGSLIIGFLLSFFSIKFIMINEHFEYNPNMGNNAPLIAITILLLPLFDTLRMFSIRIINGKSPFVGDRNHMHHLLIDTGYSHLVATLILIIYNIIIFTGYYSINYYVNNNNVMLLYLFLNFIIYCFWGNNLSKKIEINKIERIKFNKIDKVKRLQIADRLKPNSDKLIDNQ